MTTEPGKPAEFIDMTVEDVRAVTVAGGHGERCVVLLAETGGDHVLPIWVGRFEGDAIAIAVTRAEARRPLTYAFTAQLLEAAGARLVEVHIESLVDETFYSRVIVDGPGGRKAVDARPSDAIALALQTSVPIRASAEVMLLAGASRTELAARQVASRSAVQNADQIRERIKQPRVSWAASQLF